ncbi:hypothetical protein MXD81_12945, partial [Microbacteriaceae bacterium K1510]|nr:hypothetical protein [Microbacteriaceae bacterium K1510]
MTAADGPLRKLADVEGGKKLSRLPVASALRTHDLECEGLGRLREALTGPMGRPFTDDLRIQRSVRGPVDVTAIGKSRHIAHKIAA